MPKIMHSAAASHDHCVILPKKCIGFVRYFWSIRTRMRSTATLKMRP